jgi:hypothetical protein
VSFVARYRSVLAGVVLTLWVGTTGRAAVPEPDVLFHGVPRLNGAVLEPGDEVVIAIGSDVLQSHAIGAPQGAGNGRYVLRVPLVRIASGEARPPGPRRAGGAGDHLLEYLDDIEITPNYRFGKPPRITFPQLCTS